MRDLKTCPHCKNLEPEAIFKVNLSLGSVFDGRK